MENLYAVCCGIDVHKKLIVACLRQEQSTQIKEFGASTRELLSLADWLLEIIVKPSLWKAPVLTGNLCTMSLNLST